MATLTPSAKQQFFDANGNPLAGGKLYTYTAGTTTPLATYTSSSGGTPNTNPVILDSRGEANIWLGSAVYKFKLTTSTDVELWTVDNISSYNYDVLAALAASGGASLVGFLQSGTSAVARTVQGKLRDVVDVRDFGAIGNGIADDTAAIQAAINAANVVHFGNGTYLTDSLTGKSELKFFGVGADYGGTTIKLKTSNTTLLTFTNATNFEANNIIFRGTSTTVEKGEDVSDIGVQFNCTSAGDIDATFNNCHFLFFRDCVEQIGRNVKFNSCLFSNSKRGVYVSATQPVDVRGLELYGTRFHSMGKTGASNIGSIYIEPAANFQEVVLSGFDCDDCAVLFSGFAGMTTISSGVINKARDYGIVVDSTGSGLSADRRVFSVSNVSYWQSNAATVLGGLVKSAGTLQMLLSGLVVSGCGGHGISVNNDYALITGCQVENVGQVTNNTYDAFISTSNFTKFNGCQALQSRTSVPANKGRYGFNVPNPIGIQVDNYADSSFVTGAVKGMSEVAIAAASGTKVYTATLAGSAGTSLLEINLSGQMGGTYTKSVSTRIICSFGLTSNLIQDVTINKTDFGDATGANISLAITAAGSANQVVFTFTNADASNAFLGNMQVRELASYGSAIQSFV